MLSPANIRELALLPGARRVPFGYDTPKFSSQRQNFGEEKWMYFLEFYDFFPLFSPQLQWCSYGVLPARLAICHPLFTQPYHLAMFCPKARSISLPSDPHVRSLGAHFDQRTTVVLGLLVGFLRRRSWRWRVCCVRFLSGSHG